MVNFFYIFKRIAIQVARSVRKWQNPAKDFLRASKKVERNSPQRSIKKGWLRAEVRQEASVLRKKLVLLVREGATIYCRQRSK